jgi:hypothetical protein
VATSVGENAPIKIGTPASVEMWAISGTVIGVTRNCAPAAMQSLACPLVVTVPIPMNARSPQTDLKSVIERIASGVVKVNSITVMPFSIRTLTTFGRVSIDVALTTATRRD